MCLPFFNLFCPPPPPLLVLSYLLTCPLSCFVFFLRLFRCFITQDAISKVWSCLVLCLVLSYLVWSCLVFVVMSCVGLCYVVLSCLVLSCVVLPCLALPCVLFCVALCYVALVFFLFVKDWPLTFVFFSLSKTGCMSLSACALTLTDQRSVRSSIQHLPLP